MNELLEQVHQWFATEGITDPTPKEIEQVVRAWRFGGTLDYDTCTALLAMLQPRQNVQRFARHRGVRQACTNRLPRMRC